MFLWLQLLYSCCNSSLPKRYSQRKAQLLKMYVSYFDPVLSKIVLGNIMCKIGIQIRYSFALFELSRLEFLGIICVIRISLDCQT